MNDELLIKFLLNETNSDEATLVKTWIAANSENAKYYKQFERIWNESAALAKQSAVDEELAWQKFKLKVNSAPVVAPIVKKLSIGAVLLRVAAVFLVCTGVWLVYQNWFGTTMISSEQEIVQQQLPDGSNLTLNKNTNISYAGNFKRNRKVEIKSGEVFFDVAHDRSHPFTIKVEDVEVEVVGTSFNIKKSNAGVEVIVESGIVSISKDGRQLRLTKGESILLGAGTQHLEKRTTTDELHNYYRTGIFVANNTSLSKLTNVLADAYGEEIVLSDDIKGEKIFTTLPLKYTLDKNLQRICETLDLKMQRNQGKILLSKK
jgi:ferric-dicitrate binding protein FerR (iron transport regulator)